MSVKEGGERSENREETDEQCVVLRRALRIGLGKSTSPYMSTRSLSCQVNLFGEEGESSGLRALGRLHSRESLLEMVEESTDSRCEMTLFSQSVDYGRLDGPGHVGCWGTLHIL